MQNPTTTKNTHGIIGGQTAVDGNITKLLERYKMCRFKLFSFVERAFIYVKSFMRVRAFVTNR